MKTGYHRRIALFVCTLAALAAAFAADPARWPGWRGPDGNGLSSATAPDGWTAEEALLWRSSIEGRGHSSPIIWDGRVFLTAALEGDPIAGAGPVTHKLGDKDFVHPDSMGGDREHTFKVMSLDAGSGRLLWSKTAYRGRVYDDRHKRSSYASPTPTTDGERVYTYFGSQGVYAYDFDGDLAWKADLGGIATLGMGVGSSPVLYREHLILVCDQDMGEGSFMVALNRHDGTEVWRVQRPVQVSWSTPLLVTHEGRTELIVNGNEWIISYDPQTGREWWRLKGLQSNAIATPLIHGDTVILSAGYPQKITRAVRLGGTGDLTGTDSVVWEYNKGTSYVGSYLLQNGRLYLYNDKGVMTCLDAATGEVRYEGGRPPRPVSIYASPLGLDSRVLMTAGSGDLYLVSDGPVYEAVGAGSVGEPVWATPAVAGNRLFVRSEQSLSAYRLAP